MNLQVNFDKKTVAIIVLLLLLIFGAGYHFDQINKKNQKILEKENLGKALTDSVHRYKNKEGDWVNEKLTLQTDLKDLKDKNLNLTTNQQNLVKAVDAINKHNQVISAAMIQMGVKLDGLTSSEPVVETDSTERFTSNPKDTTLTYEIIVNNVKRYNPNILPTLDFRKFDLPNTQTVEFHWKDDKKEGYPISFTVTNTNPYYKVYNIDSYAIPELTKANVKPNFWQKLGKFSKSTGGKIIFFGAGVIVGAALVK
jgi:hypothetical protein